MRNQTKYELRRKITIKHGIRLGGVLSVIEYATLINEIAKKLERKDMGITNRIPTMDG